MSSSLRHPELMASLLDAKPRRVRTGCLTCRERHLKCDERQPVCFNCRKSNRTCKRGIRLNFLNAVVRDPPRQLTTGHESNVEFQDESRAIASEYRGGLGKYRDYDSSLVPGSALQEACLSSKIANQELAPASGASEDALTLVGAKARRPQVVRAASVTTRSMLEMADDFGPNFTLSSQSDNGLTVNTSEGSAISLGSIGLTQDSGNRTPSTSVLFTSADSADIDCGSIQHAQSDGLMTPPPEHPVQEERDYLCSAEEVHYLQTFVENVAVWLDAFNEEKYFGRTLPHQALKSPMLLNAALACGVKHLCLHKSGFQGQALPYYDTASSQLLRSLQNPDRNTSECAITAQVLNVFEIMSRQPVGKMNHVRGARALIKDCGWDASAAGCGRACFWLNVTIEVLDCLVMKWPLTWHPDDWGLASLKPSSSTPQRRKGEQEGQEEEWLRAIFSIMARIVNFHSQHQQFLRSSPQEGKVRQRERSWKQLKDSCDKWLFLCPQVMHPVGYVAPQHDGRGSSLFPQIWLSHPAATLSRLFYHVSLILLSQTHPRRVPRASEGMRSMEKHHARAVCGIVAGLDDRMVAVIAPRCLVVAAAVLDDGKEQEEVVVVLDRLASLHWSVQSAKADLQAIWGRGVNSASIGPPETHSLPHPPNSAETDLFNAFGLSMDNSSAPCVGGAIPLHGRSIEGAMNPLASADFRLPDHPYKSWYEPPNRGSPAGQALF